MSCGSSATWEGFPPQLILSITEVWSDTCVMHIMPRSCKRSLLRLKRIPKCDESDLRTAEKRVTFFQAIIPLSQLYEGSSVCYNSCSWYTRFFTSGHCALLKCNNFFVVVFFNPLMCCTADTVYHAVPKKKKYTHSGHTVVKLHWDTVPQQGGTLTRKECKGANSSDTQLWTAALKSKWITWSQICTIYNHINFWSDFLKGFMGDNNVSLKKRKREK